jgi:translation initiation factor 3 subunit D
MTSRGVILTSPSASCGAAYGSRSAIMTAPKSLYSWDVIIKKYQDKLFIDKRDDENILDFLTVNETSNEN